MSSQKLIIGQIFLFLLCSCSIFSPYEDRRRNAGAQDVRFLYSGPSKPEAPVICYNGLLTSDAELQQMADDICINQQTGDKAEFIRKTYFDGKLLLPNHAYYKCVKNNEEKNELTIGK